MSFGRGNGLGPSDWGRLLSGPSLTGLKELNGLSWSPNRRAAVHSTLERVARRNTTAHMDLRFDLKTARKFRFEKSACPTTS